MARPSVGVTTERLYELLPEFYRTVDEGLDYPLLRYLSLVLDQVSDIEDVADRLLEGDLMSSVEADDAWLDWLAQLVGARLYPFMTEQERRDAVTYSTSGWRAGTRQTVMDAASTALTGTRYVRVYDHSVDVTNIGLGTVWDVLLVTRTSETPDLNAVLDAVERLQAKPAGVVLYHSAYESDWATIESALPTWDSWETLTWDELQETRL